MPRVKPKRFGRQRKKWSRPSNNWSNHEAMDWDDKPCCYKPKPVKIRYDICKLVKRIHDLEKKVAELGTN